jgi:flagellin
MSISFQTNVAAMIAATNLSNNNNFETQTITRLTSGYRINSSGDDAAGLAVANQYRDNVSELTQGVLNANDGVSALQIVDGGLNNISTMLDRMKTLATESASTTFTGNRGTLDNEYQTLIGEINREAGNIGLGETNATNATELSVYIGGGPSSTTGSQVQINLTHGKVDAAALGLAGTSVAGTAPVTVGTVANGSILEGATETFTVNTAAGSSTFGITGESGDTVTSQLTRLNADLGTVGISASLDANGNLAFSSPAAFSVSVAGAGLAADGDHGRNTALNNGALTYDTTEASSYTVTEGSTTANISLTAGMTDTQALAAINSQLQTQGITNISAVAEGTLTAGVPTPGAYSLQSSSTFTDTLVNANAGTASVNAVAPAVGSGGALDAINAINTAVQNLGNVQGIVGAGENDLNYAIGLANSQITNFSAADSRIRDADVATEAANLTKAQVLMQASVAAMAQANSSPQAVLALLKNT